MFASCFLLPQQNHEKITLASAADLHQPWKKDSRMEELYQRSIIIRLIRGMIIKMIGWHVSCWQKYHCLFLPFYKKRYYFLLSLDKKNCWHVKIRLYVTCWQGRQGREEEAPGQGPPSPPWLAPTCSAKLVIENHL